LNAKGPDVAARQTCREQVFFAMTFPRLPLVFLSVAGVMIVSVWIVGRCFLSMPVPPLVAAPSQYKLRLRKLALDARLVVVGSVKENRSYVVDKKRMVGKATKRRDGIVLFETPSPGDFVLGRFMTIQVDRVLKGRVVSNADDTLQLFVNKMVGSMGEPAFLQAERYVLFMEPLDGSDGTFATARLWSPPAASMPQFKPESLYKLVNRDAAVKLRTGTDAEVETVQDALENR
jgi:hypothetical protein